MTATLLRRGLIAGLLAGLLAGAFAFVSGEPAMDRSIQLEQTAAHEHAHDHSHEEEELFSRSQQKAGLFFATGLFGVTFGGLFGLAYAYFGERLRAASEWGRSLTLAGAGFLAVFLVPFVKYPANPPTVGEPETIGVRTASYFGLIALSLAVLVAGWAAARAMRRRGVSAPARQIPVTVGCVAVLAAAYLLLPASPDPGEFPGGLLWEFRMSSFGTQVVFWAALGAVFGLLGERAGRREAA